MTPLTTLEGVAAPLRMAHVDTDKILPGRFLKTIQRKGLGNALFIDQRQDPEFILNRSPWNRASLLIAGENFGCGSSREHAVWALLDFGIRCVIAPSFADIFFNNCFKSGILPIVLSEPDVEFIMDLVSSPQHSTVKVDLENQIVSTDTGKVFKFKIFLSRKNNLLSGADEIAGSLKYREDIEMFERRRFQEMSWLPPITQSAIDQSGASLLGLT